MSSCLGYIGLNILRAEVISRAEGLIFKGIAIDQECKCGYEQDIVVTRSCHMHLLARLS